MDIWRAPSEAADGAIMVSMIEAGAGATSESSHGIGRSLIVGGGPFRANFGQVRGVRNTT